MAEPDTTRVLTGGPLDGKTIDLTLAEHDGIGGVLLPQTEGNDDRLHSYEPGLDRDGRLYYQDSIG